MLFCFYASIFGAYTNADLFGKSIFLMLFFLSVLSWTILIQKVRVTRRFRRECFAFEKKIDREVKGIVFEPQKKIDSFSFPYLEIHDWLRTKMMEILKKNRHFSSSDGEVFLSGADIDLLDGHAQVAISKEVKKLESNLFVLSTIITLAPFLGLLGTVWGILITFSNLPSQSLSMGNAAVLAGLSMALATTVVGLVVAIPSLIAYNYLKHEIANFTKDMHHFSYRLLTNIEMQYRKIE